MSTPHVCRDPVNASPVLVSVHSVKGSVSCSMGKKTARAQALLSQACFWLTSTSGRERVAGLLGAPPSPRTCLCAQGGSALTSVSLTRVQ